jgi:hypothetical protein
MDAHSTPPVFKPDVVDFLSNLTSVENCLTANPGLDACKACRSNYEDVVNQYADLLYKTTTAASAELRLAPVDSESEVLTGGDVANMRISLYHNVRMLFYSESQRWEVQWISITQTLHLEPIFYFFGGQTLNLKRIKFFLQVRTSNLEPVFFFFLLNGRTLNLGPFAAKTCKPWDLEPQTLNLNMRDFPDLPLAMNINDCRTE